MTYKINATILVIQPTSGRWVERELIGRDGNGAPRYSRFRAFELRWNLISVAQMYQLQTMFNAMEVTGTYVADLPRYGAGTYAFFSYSGCYIDEPIWGTYFSEYPEDVRLTITHIET